MMHKVIPCHLSRDKKMWHGDPSLGMMKSSNTEIQLPRCVYAPKVPPQPVLAAGQPAVFGGRGAPGVDLGPARGPPAAPQGRLGGPHRLVCKNGFWWS